MVTSRARPAVAAFVLTVLLVAACASLTSVTGRVVVKGSEPHTYLAIVHAGGEYAVVGELAGRVAEYQNLVITVEGVVTAEAAGPGMPARLEVRRILLP